MDTGLASAILGGRGPLRLRASWMYFCSRQWNYGITTFKTIIKIILF